MSQQGTIDDLLDALKSVDTFKLKIFRANSPADLSAAQAGLARVTHSISQRFPEFNNDLISTFHQSYTAAGGTGPVPKPFYQKAYRSRVKANKGFERATTGLRQWGNSYGQERQVIKARQAYKAQIAKLERTGGTPEQIAAAKRALAGLPKGVGVSDTPSVFYNRKTKKGITRVVVPAQTYMKMAANAAYSTQRNLGVAAAASKASGWVIVEDGPGCGQASHRDGSPVNGQVWEASTAMQFPISHPNCQRSFRVSPGPPNGKKTKDLLRSLNLKPSKGKASTLKAIAEAAAGAGVVANIGATIIQNPFIQRFMRELIADKSIRLAPAAQQLITRLQTYGVREARAFEERGAALGAKTQEQFDRLVGESFDSDLANERFLVRDSSERIVIRPEQARVLGLSTKPTKGELMTKLDDYGDYLLHKESLQLSIEERIQTAANLSHAKEELYRTAALKFHIDPAQGLNAHRNWYNVVHKLKETYDLSPDKADRDLIRLAASVLDPTPWLRAQLAPGVKFTMGMTSRGRADLAVRIFDKVKHGRLLSDTEAKWAEQLGMDFAKLKAPESIRMKHVVNAFQPRITYQPGGLFSGTIAVKGGKIIPIIRMYPDGTFGRFVSLESKLRAGAVEDFIKALRSKDLPIGERWIDALSNVAQEDLITSLNLFRNSPLQVSLRMVGLTPESFAIRALPDNDFLRYSYRFTLNTAQRTAIQTEVRNRLLAGEGIDEIVNSMVKGPVKTIPEHRAKEKAAKELVRKEAAAIAKKDLENWVEGITVLPNYGGGFTMNGISIGQREALIKMKMLGNNLLIIGKKTHYGYDQLLAMWKESKTLFEDFIKTVSESDLANIHSFDDATKLLGDAFRRKSSIIDQISGEDLSRVDLSFASQEALENPALRDDLAKFRLAWERQFPGGSLPEVRLVDVLDNPLEARPGVILIRKDVADDWELMGKLRRKAVRLGHFPPDTEASVNNLIHEAAHATLLDLDEKTLEFLMRRAMTSQGWPGGVKGFSTIDIRILKKRLESDEFQRRIARTLSGYGTTSIDEFLAEAMTEYFGSSNPRAIATAVGDNLTKVVNDIQIFDP